MTPIVIEAAASDDELIAVAVAFYDALELAHGRHAKTVLRWGARGWPSIRGAAC